MDWRKEPHIEDCRGNWERWESKFSPRPSQRSWPCSHLDFRILGLQICKIINLHFLRH